MLFMVYLRLCPFWNWPVKSNLGPIKERQVTVKQPIIVVKSNLADRPNPEEPVIITEISTPPTKSFRIPRSAPAPEPPRKIQKIKRRSAKTIEQRVNREIKKKQKSRIPLAQTRRHCKICNISCNSRQTFVDHIQSRKHKNKKTNIQEDLSCYDCDREFESKFHLESHKKGKFHLRTLERLSNKW